LNVQGASEEDLSIVSPINLEPWTEEPTAISSPTASSFVSSTDNFETASQRSTIASAAPSEFVLLEGRFLQLIHSGQVPRYEKDITIAREERLYVLEPLTTKFPYFPESNRSDQASPGKDCSPWTPATHPDGGLYFYDSERRLFTDTDMHDPTLKEEMEDFYRYLQKILCDDQLTIPSEDYDLVLDIMPAEEETVQWSYYYACHETRCLFWLEEYDGSHMTSELHGVDCPAHVKHCLEGLYWQHWSLFPVVFGGRRLPLDVYDELMRVLVHGCVDVLTSKSSTFPYDDATTEKMIRLVQKAKGTSLYENGNNAH